MKDRCHLRARLWICGSRMLEAVPIISTLFRSSLCFRFHHEEGQNHNQKMFTCTCWYLLFLLQPWYMFWFRLNFTPGLARKWMCIYINKSVCVCLCALTCVRVNMEPIWIFVFVRLLVKSWPLISSPARKSSMESHYTYPWSAYFQGFKH